MDDNEAGISMDQAVSTAFDGFQRSRKTHAGLFQETLSDEASDRHARLAPACGGTAHLHHVPGLASMDLAPGRCRPSGNRQRHADHRHHACVVEHRFDVAEIYGGDILNTANFSCGRNRFSHRSRTHRERRGGPTSESPGGPPNGCAGQRIPCSATGSGLAGSGGVERVETAETMVADVALPSPARQSTRFYQLEILEPPIDQGLQTKTPPPARGRWGR